MYTRNVKMPNKRKCPFCSVQIIVNRTMHYFCFLVLFVACLGAELTEVSKGHILSKALTPRHLRGAAIVASVSRNWEFTRILFNTGNQIHGFLCVFIYSPITLN